MPVPSLDPHPAIRDGSAPPVTSASLWGGKRLTRTDKAIAGCLTLLVILLSVVPVSPVGTDALSLRSPAPGALAAILFPIALAIDRVITSPVPLLVLLVGAGLAGTFLRVAMLGRAQEREDAAVRKGATTPLVAGSCRFVRGRVEPLDAADVVLEVDIEQTVENFYDKKAATWSHQWTERARRTSVHPFCLARDTGNDIYVESPKSVLVIDTLKTSHAQDRPEHRVLSAVVRRGQEVYVYGTLESDFHAHAGAGYRGAAEVWTLRGPKRGPMLVATDAIGDRYFGRIAHHRVVGTVFGVVFLLYNVIVTLPFFLATIFGVHTSATVTFVQGCEHPYKLKREEPMLTLRAADGSTWSQDVEFSVCRKAKGDLEARTSVAVPVMRTFDWAPASYVGNFPTLPAALYVGGYLSAVAFAVCVFSHRESFAWYDKRKIRETAEGRWDGVTPPNA
jgi:hypothetical protein